MRLISLDFETFYSPSYGLKNLTTEEYVMGEEFEVIGVSIKVGEDLAKWYTGTHAELKEILGGYKLETAVVLAHNCAFDAFILSQIFGIYPAKYLDTLSMARALHGVSVGGSLAALVKQYGLGEKGTEVVNALGKHRKDFTPTEMAAYAGYCINDTELCYALFKVLVKKFNIMELEVIHLTIRMWVIPLLELDISSAEEYLVDVRAKKQALLDSIVDSKEVLMSNPRFANALEALGVEVPLKISPATGKQAYAFAKTDDGLKDLMEYPDVRVQALVAARLGLKSTIEETRAERYIGIAKRMGVIPVPLSYYGASTGRFTACLVADTVLTVYNKYQGVISKRIVDVLLDDLIWDGGAFVPHDGVVFNGYAEVISYDGITGTKDHEVFTEDGQMGLYRAMQGQSRITVAGSITENAVESARILTSIYKD